MSESAADVRAFVALELPAELRAALASLIGALAERLRGARFVRPEGIHLTLRFLGAAAPERLARLEPKLARAAAECPAADVATTALGSFPPRGAPRVLWLGLDLPQGVLALQRACERAACEAGFAAEPRPFAPHLTLARFRDRVPRPDLGPGPLPLVARLDTLALLKSDLRPGGAVYTRLAAFPLAHG